MDIQTLLQWLQLAQDHKWNYLGFTIAVVVIGWLTSLTSDWSRFPLTIPGRWQPAVAGFLGLLYAPAVAGLAALKTGAPLRPALLASVESGVFAAAMTAFLFDLVINGFLNGNVPPWMQRLSFVKKKPAPAPLRVDPNAPTDPPAAL